MTDELLVRVALSRAAQHGSQSLLALVADEGPQVALERLGGDLRSELLSQAERDLAALTRLGGRVVIPSDDEWPRQLDELGACPDLLGTPVALWVLGDAPVSEICARAISVVGSRACTSHGQVVASEISGGIAQAGWTVISGAAHGIDGFAHQGALRAGGRTLAVLACGVDVAYPEAHRNLLTRIRSDGGLVISEVPCGIRPARWRFLTRNRVIAALSRGTVLIEAGLRSGALNTVAHAHALGRQVCVVPGPVGPAATAGCQRELRRGRSSVVSTAADVLEDIAPVGEHLCTPSLWPAGPRDGLSESQGALLELFPARGAVSPEDLATRCGGSFRSVVRDLGALETAGLVQRNDGMVALTQRAKTPNNGVVGVSSLS